MCAFWDASAKKRLRQYPRFPSPLSAGAISCNGALFVVAAGAENIEDSRHVGPGAGEVGGLGQGGTGNVRILVKGSIFEDGKVRLACLSACSLLLCRWVGKLTTRCMCSNSPKPNLEFVCRLPFVPNASMSRFFFASYALHTWLLATT